jgi:hypothetical protein
MTTMGGVSLLASRVHAAGHRVQALQGNSAAELAHRVAADEVRNRLDLLCAVRADDVQMSEVGIERMDNRVNSYRATGGRQVGYHDGPA